MIRFSILLGLSIVITGCGGGSQPGEAGGSKNAQAEQRDYITEFKKLTMEGQEEGENAWPALQEAGRIVQDIIDQVEAKAGPDALVSLSFILMEESETTDASSIAASRMAFRQVEASRAFSLFAQAAKAVNMVEPLQLEDGLLFKHLPPPIGRPSYYRLIQAKLTSAVFSLQKGDEATFVEGIDQILTVIMHLSHNPRLRPGFDLIFLQHIHKEIRRAITEGELSGDSCRTLLASIDRNRCAPLSKFIEAQLIIYEQLIDLVFNDDPSDTSFTKQDLIDHMKRTIFMSTNFDSVTENQLPSRDEMLDLLRAHHEWWRSETGLRQFERRVTKEFVQEEIDRLGPRYTILHSQLQYTPPFFYVHDSTALEVLSARMMLALEIHKSVTGEYPESIRDLDYERVSDFYIDPVNGKSFGYRKRGNTRYILYTYGLDGEDNSGREHRIVPNFALLDIDKGEAKSESEGVDYVFNKVRK